MNHPLPRWARHPTHLPRRSFTGAALALAMAPLARAAALDGGPETAPPLPHWVAPGGPVRVEGVEELVGEIHVDWPVDAPPPTVWRLVDADRGETVEVWEDAELARRVARIDGARMLLYVELRSRPGRPLPARLLPALTLANGQVLRGEAVAVSAEPATAFGPPLKDGLWVAIHNPAWPRGHRRVGFARDGRWTIPGRHAIDFVQVDEDGRIARGDAGRPANHFGYGAPVLAVADGVVSASRDDMVEANTIAGNPRHALVDAPGNHVVLTLADHRHVLYEHLRPGSVTVRPGDRVRKGQVLGALGFSGDSTGPHLHLHVCDEGAPNAGEGLPFVFERFERLGAYEDLATLGRARWSDAPAGDAMVRRDEKPGSNRVIRFTAT